MKRGLWVLQTLLAVLFVLVGSMKVVTPREQLKAGWTNDFSSTQIKLIGTAEIAGAIGLIVPAATGILPVLTPVAAVGLALLMGGAVATHLQRAEPFVVPLALALLAAVVAWGRFRAPAGAVVRT
jgi:uncharacterized membrane protein